MSRSMPRWGWALAGFALALVVAMMVGFGADPVPQPQRVSDLVARLDALEATNAQQAAAIESLTTRVARLEQTAGITESLVSPAEPPPPAETIPLTVPTNWRQGVASDGILVYHYAPDWEVTLDEPGNLNFWVDAEYGLFFSWDWPVNLLDTLQDEAFMELFEGELFGDESTDVKVLESGATTLAGFDGYFWEMAIEFEDGLDTQMRTVIYACNERTSCSATLVRLGRTPGFDAEEQALLEVFATGVEFLNVGKATVTANANLRACPSVTCEIIGRAIEGEIIEIVGQSSDGGWYRLRSGAWIAASLVEGAPSSLPILDGGSEL